MSSVVVGARARSKRSVSSPIYKHFTLANGVQSCKNCEYKSSAGLAANTILWYHMRSKHSQLLKKDLATKEEVDLLIGSFFASNLLPYNIAESPEFISMIEGLNSTIQPPTSLDLSTKIIPRMNSDLLEYTRQALTPGEWAATSDGWRSKRGRFDIVSITSRFLDGNFKMHHVVTAARQLDGRHSGQNLANFFESTAMENVSSMPSILCTDNARNMKAMASKMNVLWIGCSVHLINLVNGKCLTSCAYVKALVVKIRKFADSLSRSPAKYDTLAREVIGRQLEPRRVPYDCPTRWWTTSLLMSYIIDFHLSINAVSSQIGVDPYTSREISIMEKIVETMGITEQAGRYLCRDTTNASEIIPTMYKMVMDLEINMESLDGEAGSFATAMHQQAIKRFEECVMNKVVMFAMLIDFRFAFRDELVSLNGGGSAIWDSTVADFVDYFDSVVDPVTHTASPTPPTTPSTSSSLSPSTLMPAGKKRKSPTSEEFFGSLLKRKKTNSPMPIQKNIQMEIAEYRIFIETVDCDDPLDFWRSNASKFPLLSKCARRLLCCPATSIKSEQMFSSCTQFANQLNRSNLGVKKFEEQLLVKVNRHFISASRVSRFDKVDYSPQESSSEYSDAEED